MKKKILLSRKQLVLVNLILCQEQNLLEVQLVQVFIGKTQVRKVDMDPNKNSIGIKTVQIFRVTAFYVLRTVGRSTTFIQLDR